MNLNGCASPYIVGPPVVGADFYGRRHQIDQFLQTMSGSTLQSLRVLGLRRSGKTSFLHHVASLDVAGPAAQGHALPTVIAYVTLQAGVATPADFCLTVADAIADNLALDTRPEVPDSFATYRSFTRWLNGVCAAANGLRMVVMLDEFELLTASDEFKPSFFQFLRSLVNSQFMWVTASYSDLHLALGSDDLTSPFFNVFHPSPIILGSLEPEEADSLIREPLRKVGVELSSEEIRVIQEIAGPMPYLLQATADRWFRTRKPDTPIGQCRTQVVTGLLDQHSLIQRQLDHYWRRLTKPEKDCICRLAREDSGSDGDWDVQNKLLRFGLLIAEGDRLKVAGEGFRTWITSHYERICPVIPPTEIAPFVPIIVEATKFAFNEASKLIEEIRKKPTSEGSLPKTAPDLPPKAKAQIVGETTDLQVMAELMDSAMAEQLVDDIQALIRQIRIHRRNLNDLQTTKAKYGIDVPIRVQREIEDEERGVVEKTARLAALLDQVYRK